LNQPDAIAVIDDDASVRQALESLLRSCGYNVLMFESALAFLASPRRGEIGCIISDVQMPMMTGPELQDRLIAEECAPPMIFITAFPEQSVEARVLDRGAIAILHKPFNGNDMISHVETALSASGAR